MGAAGTERRFALRLDRIRVSGAGDEISSPQRFYLSLYGNEGVQRRQLHPLPNVWIRAAVPLRYYREPNRAGHDLASVGKVPRNSFWISTGGVYGPLNAVQAIGVTMQAPWENPHSKSARCV